VPTPVIAISGFSNSGKTRVATSLVRILNARGYRVGAVKHCHHGFDVDRPESDTAQLERAGAVAVIASAPGGVYVTERTPDDPSLESLLGRFEDSGVDVIIAEGFKSSGVHKVLVIGADKTYPEALNAFAVVCDQNSSGPALPTYRFDESEELVDLIIRDHLPNPDAFRSPTKYPSRLSHW